MRRYRVYYWKEINDECVDCEKEIEAPNISIALLRIDFVCKRIYKIEEI